MTETPHTAADAGESGGRRRRRRAGGGARSVMRHLTARRGEAATPGLHPAVEPDDSPTGSFRIPARAFDARPLRPGEAPAEPRDPATIIDAELVEDDADAMAGTRPGAGAVAPHGTPVRASSGEPRPDTDEIPVANAIEFPDDFMDAHHDEWGIVAEGLEVRGSEGPVYGPIDVAVPAEGLTVLSGRGGSGRTALALTFAGRMRPTGGRLRVLGMDSRGDIRRHVAIAGVDQLDELDRNLTVRATLTEYRYWTRGPLWFPPKVDEAYLEELAGPIYGSRGLPPLDAFVSQLPSLDRHLLRIALALHPAHGTPQEMLIVDDLEQVRELEERLWLLSRLVELSHDIPVVVNAVNPLPEHLVPAHRQIRLDTDAGHINPVDGGFDRHSRQFHDDVAEAMTKEARP